MVNTLADAAAWVEWQLLHFLGDAFAQRVAAHVESGHWSISIAFSGIGSPEHASEALVCVMRFDGFLSASATVQHVAAIEYNEESRFELQVSPWCLDEIFVDISEFMSPRIRNMILRAVQ